MTDQRHQQSHRKVHRQSQHEFASRPCRSGLTSAGVENRVRHRTAEVKQTLSAPRASKQTRSPSQLTFCKHKVSLVRTDSTRYKVIWRLCERVSHSIKYSGSPIIHSFLCPKSDTLISDICTGQVHFFMVGSGALLLTFFGTPVSCLVLFVSNCWNGGSTDSRAGKNRVDS